MNLVADLRICVVMKDRDLTPISSSICFEHRSCSSALFIAGAKCFRSEVIRACENGLANFCCKKKKREDG
jgi:hypothetical protein